MREGWIILFNRHGNHDKVYAVWINRGSTTYYVFGSWGRRSAYLRGGIDALAQKVYAHSDSLIDAVVKAEALAISKVRNGYTTNTDGVSPCFMPSLEMRQKNDSSVVAPSFVPQESTTCIIAQPRRRLLEL